MTPAGGKFNYSNMVWGRVSKRPSLWSWIPKQTVWWMVNGPLRRATSFGSYVSSEGGTQKYVSERVDTAWLNWWRWSGVVCGSEISWKLKSRICRTVTRSTAMFESEGYLASEKGEKRVGIAGTHVEVPFRARTPRPPYSWKTQESHGSYHSQRQPLWEAGLDISYKGTVTLQLMSLVVEETRPKRKLRQADKTNADSKEVSAQEEETQDREKWWSEIAKPYSFLKRRGVVSKQRGKHADFAVIREKCQEKRESSE